MPAFLVGLFSGLLELMKPMVGRVLLALGLGVALYQGIDLAADALLVKVGEAFGDIAGDLASVAGLLGVDAAISLVLSAHVSVISIKLLHGPIRRIVGKAPA